MWDRYDSSGMISWANSRFTVINANNTFASQYDGADTFIKSELERRNINTEYGLKLVEVRKVQSRLIQESQTAVFENIRTGERSERPYNNFYSLLEAKPDSNLAEAGLAASNGLLDVDPFTLQHKKYNNIFGFGDVANLPTSKTFYAGFNQLHVVRHNLERHLNGLSASPVYDEHSSAFIHLGLSSSATVSHFYDGKPDSSLDTGLMASLRYKLADSGKKGIMDLLKFKSWGPPYHKFKKTFNDSKSTSSSTPESLEINKKTA